MTIRLSDSFELPHPAHPQNHFHQVPHTNDIHSHGMRRTVQHSTLLSRPPPPLHLADEPPHQVSDVQVHRVPASVCTPHIPHPVKVVLYRTHPRHSTVASGHTYGTLTGLGRLYRYINLLSVMIDIAVPALTTKAYQFVDLWERYWPR
ncbi:hypothetical protein GQ43DRAFT_263870 [Delitschia confertaspora ATCC 74209]|uniref:Uncharacterized protein n=1 Tax=Delitschia confertaspora ATCC 74209 TaxID=1513339 RepID=A0A9P4JQT5_9PLEO|nr:hypothetical protein GQ43DRAFT_263870 [Delitschia confertaspora ATCC 74209]